MPEHTYHINSTPELKTARSLMLWGIGIYIVGNLFGIVSDALGGLAMLVGIVVGLIGLYKFSKLTQSRVFKYYFLLFITPFVALFVGVIFALQGILTSLQTPLLIIFAIAYAIAYIYYARKMSYIMAYLTGNREFLTAWKIFKIALIASLILGGVIGFSAGFGDYSVDSGGAFAFILLIVGFIVGIVFLISQIFVLMGVYKIREAKVLEPNALTI